MTSEVSSTTTDQTSPGLVSGSSSTSSFDSHSLQITQHKLNGLNFREWFQSVILVIRGRGKVGYLTGVVTPPSDTAPIIALGKQKIPLSWLGSLILWSQVLDELICFTRQQRRFGRQSKKFIQILKTHLNVLRFDQRFVTPNKEVLRSLNITIP